MAYAQPVVTQEENIWVIRLQNRSGKMQEYRCATETQARQLAMVLSKPDAEAPRAQPA